MGRKGMPMARSWAIDVGHPVQSLAVVCRGGGGGKVLGAGKVLGVGGIAKGMTDHCTGGRRAQIPCCSGVKAQGFCCGRA